MIIGTYIPPSRGWKFTEADAFIGYQNDTPAAVVFQATRQLEGGDLAVSPQRQERTESVNDLVEEGVEDSHTWKENVSFLLHQEFILAYGSTPYLGMTLIKMAATLKVHK